MRQLVDYLFELTKRVVVMDGHKYVYLDDLKEVSLILILYNFAFDILIYKIKGDSGISGVYPSIS